MLPLDAPRTPTISPLSEMSERAIGRVVELVRGWLSEQPEQVLQVVGRQARQLVVQQQEIAHYQQQVSQLQQELARVQEQPRRSAAPFAIADEKRKAEPKRPGRSVGHPGEWRRAPVETAWDEQVEVPLECCPDCGAALVVSQQQVIEQTILELPVVKPKVIRLRTYRNHCEQCQRTVQSHHPLQVSLAVGAAGTHLGARALAVATALNKDFKLPLRKSCQILQQCFGLSLSPGGLSQAVARVAQRLKPDYQQVLEQLRQSEVVYSDETGWWLNGPGYTLWVFTNNQTTYYRIVPSREKRLAAFWENTSAGS